MTIKAASAKGASEPGLLDKWQEHSWDEMADAKFSTVLEEIQQTIGSGVSEQDLGTLVARLKRRIVKTRLMVVIFLKCLIPKP